VLLDLEVNDARISFGKRFTMPSMAYQLGMENGWWYDPYNFWFALKLVCALVVLVKYAHEGHNFSYWLSIRIVV
jgi:hypothetical protein